MGQAVGERGITVFQLKWPARKTSATDRRPGIGLFARRRRSIDGAVPRRILRLEFIAGKQAILSGDWEAEVLFNGRAAIPVSPYAELCRASDDEVEYLELGIALSRNLRLERHVVLAKKDRLLWLADAVLGPPGINRLCRGGCPSAAGKHFRPSGESCEGLSAAGAAWRKSSLSPCRNGETIRAYPKTRLVARPSRPHRAGRMPALAGFGIDGALQHR